MVQRYDPITDTFVELTQEFWNKYDERVQILAAYCFGKPSERALIPNPEPLTEIQLNTRLTIFANPMRTDGVFIAEDKEILPYEGVTELDGKNIYPAVPQCELKVNHQIEPKFAAELVRRWNYWIDQQQAKKVS